MVRDITAYQGVVGRWVNHFGYMKWYNLREYHDDKAPVVVFGIYSLDVIKSHKGIVIVHWCGNDARKQVKNYSLFHRSNIINVTPLPAVKRFLEARGVKCGLIRLVTDERAKPLKKGPKVYAYLNKNKPLYHGSAIVDQLKEYPFVIGDFSVDPKLWNNGVKDKYYSQCYVGLFLSDYAGGGYGIAEIGLRGISVVTNVLDLPHCFPWKNIKDIKAVIDAESANIGTKEPELAQRVENCLIHSSELNGFELAKLWK